MYLADTLSRAVNPESVQDTTLDEETEAQALPTLIHSLPVSTGKLREIRVETENDQVGMARQDSRNKTPQAIHAYWN